MNINLAFLSDLIGFFPASAWAVALFKITLLMMLAWGLHAAVRRGVRPFLSTGLGMVLMLGGMRIMCEAKPLSKYDEAKIREQPFAQWELKGDPGQGTPRTWEVLMTDSARSYPVWLTWPKIQGAGKYIIHVEGVKQSQPAKTFQSRKNVLKIGREDLPPGRYEWTVTVQDKAGKTLGRVETIDPVSVFAIADPAPPRRNGQKVLLDLAHSQSIIHGWGRFNEAQSMMKELLEQAGFEVLANEREALTPDRLRSANLLIENFFWRGRAPFRPYDKSELNAVREFVSRGGSLLLVACDRRDTDGHMISFGNPLAQEFGFKLEYGPIDSVDNWAKLVAGQKIISLTRPLPTRGAVAVTGADGVSLMEVKGASIGRAKSFGKGKVIVAGVGTSFIDAGLGSLDESGGIQPTLFFDFVRYLTGIESLERLPADERGKIQARLQSSEMPVLVRQMVQSIGWPEENHENRPPAPPATPKPAGLFPSVKIDYASVNRHKQDAYPYQEQKWKEATHVLGTIHSEVTWTRGKSPYVVDENLYVTGDGILKVEPGVTVKFTKISDTINPQKELIGLNVSGRLLAEGTPRDLIRFVSTDPGTPQCNKWRGIQLGRGAHISILKWCWIDSAGFGIEPTGMQLIAHNVITHCHTGIWLAQGFCGTISHNVLAYHEYNGILCHTTGPEAYITDNIFYRNGQGIEGLWGASPYADYNRYWNGQDEKSPGRSYTKIEPGPHDKLTDPLFDNPAQDGFQHPKQPGQASDSPDGQIGLDAGHYGSPQAVADETAHWLSGGARESLQQGLALEAEGRFNEAKMVYAEALGTEKAPTHPAKELSEQLNTGLGRALKELKEDNEAEKILRGAIEKSNNPHRRDQARRALAEALTAEGKASEAAVLLTKLEWPQSRVWAPTARAQCKAKGDPIQALKSLARLRKKDPDGYLKALSDTVEGALKTASLDSVLPLCNGFAAYPESPIGSEVRMRAAQALQGAGRTADAAKLLRKIADADPFGREAPQALALLAKIKAGANNNSKAVHQLLTRLCTDYYLFDPLVAKARQEINFKPLSPRKMILIDASQRESSIYDRQNQGSCGGGQYEVMQDLSRCGFKVHTNQNGQRLDPDELKYYGLVIMNGHYRGSPELPWNQDAIDACDAYVKNGGNLLVIATGKHRENDNIHPYYNPLLQHFGMKFNEETENQGESKVGEVAPHPALKGLDGFIVDTGSTIDPGKGEILGTHNGKPIIVALPFGKGRVVAAGLGMGLLGCYLNPHLNTHQDQIRKNQALLIRLATYLLANAPSQVPESLPSPMPPVPSRKQRQAPAASPQPPIGRQTNPLGDKDGLKDVKEFLAHYSKTKMPSDDALRGMLSQVKGAPRGLAIAIASYHLDHQSYPETIQNLTTPIAYLSEQSLKQSSDNVFKAEAGITGVMSKVDRLNDEQQKQLLAWLDKEKDPEAKFSRLGSEQERLSGLYDLFCRQRADAAKPYLARAFLKLCCADANWPPAAAHFTWIGTAFAEANQKNPQARILDQLNRVIDDFARKSPDNPRALAVCARLASQMTGYQSLSPIFAQALNAAKTDADRAQVLAWKAHCLQAESLMHNIPEKAREALLLYEKSLSLKPNEEALYSCIDTLGEVGDKQRLTAFLPKALAWFPEDDYVIHNVAGRAYFKMGADKEAEEQFRQTLATLVPGYELWQMQTRMSLAEIYAKQGKKDQARTLAREALEWNIFAAHVQRHPENTIKNYFNSKKQELQFELKGIDLSDMTFETISKGLDTQRMTKALDAMKQRRQQTHPAPPEPPANIQSQQARAVKQPVLTPPPSAGKPISEAEATKIVDKLVSRIYVPCQELKSLKLEFKPRYLDLTNLMRQRSRGPAIEYPKGIRFGFFEGFESPPFYDEALARVDKAVFSWKRPETNKTEKPNRNWAVVELYGKEGKPLEVHPFVRTMLGMACTERLWLSRLPLVMPREPSTAKPGAPSFWEKKWFLNASPTSATLTLQFRAAPRPGESSDNSWQLKEICYVPGELLPLAVSDKMWRPDQGVWMDFDTSCEFSPLGKTGRVAVSRTGVHTDRRYDWANIAGAWVVQRISGSRPAFESPGQRKMTPWTMEFTGIEINPQIPDTLMAWPERKPLKLDLSSPDATAATILACIREDRPDLLPYCYTDAPAGPPPSRVPYGELSYRFKIFKDVAASLRVKDKRQEGDHWLYTIELLDPLRTQSRSAQIKIMQKDGAWRVANEGSPLLFRLVYD